MCVLGTGAICAAMSHQSRGLHAFAFRHAYQRITAAWELEIPLQHTRNAVDNDSTSYLTGRSTTTPPPGWRYDEYFS